jgi:hypothetical protein
MTNKSPLSLLIGQLPADVALQKREAIQRDLIDLGEWEHYRQSVRRPGYNLQSTHVACAYVLKKHLGITDEFFVGDDDERDRQISEILKKSYQSQLV